MTTWSRGDVAARWRGELPGGWDRLIPRRLQATLERTFVCGNSLSAFALRRAATVLPCHSLDDFPTHLAGDEAAEVLAAWTGLWHPALLATTGQLPAWHRADDPPTGEALVGSLLVVPTTTGPQLADGWLERVHQLPAGQVLLIQRIADRREFIAELLDACGLPDKSVDEEIAADFVALGYAYLQVELLTHAMHYSGIIDPTDFTETVIAAAQAALKGDLDATREGLVRAFDRLTEARNHFYPVDFYLIDLTLLAPSTLGQPLREELATGGTSNYLATGSLIDHLARTEPETLAEMRSALASERACIVGGAFDELRLGELGPERLLSELRRGRDAYLEHLGQPTRVFGQFTAAGAPLLPRALQSLGFVGLLGSTFDGSPPIRAAQCRTRWQGPDGTDAEALVAVPQDAGQPETFLRLADLVSDSMQHDHVATLLLAGWPGHRDTLLDDLRRVAKYGPVLGRFVTLDEYFGSTSVESYWSNVHWEVPAARREWAGADPISSPVAARRAEVAASHDALLSGLASLVLKSDDHPDNTMQRLAAVTGADTSSPGSDWFATNAWSFPRAADVEQGDSQERFESLPGLGFAWKREATPPPPVPLAEENQLRNEFVEVIVSRTSGGIGALRTYADRHNRVSQRLMRIGAGSESTMVADSVEITRSDHLVGEITSRGRLVDADGQTLARFRQRLALPRYSRTLRVEVQLDPEHPPVGHGWRSYFGSRLAWNGGELPTRQGVAWLSQLATQRHFDHPDWIELPADAGLVTLFPQGLPYHRALAPAAIDTLLVVEQETARQFHFAIGLDCPYPTPVGLALLTDPVPSIRTGRDATAPDCGWWLHVPARNVVVTAIEPLPANGVRLRLLETEGRATATHLAAWRPFASARRTDTMDQPIEELPVENGQITLDVRSYEWIEIEAAWP